MCKKVGCNVTPGPLVLLARNKAIAVSADGSGKSGYCILALRLTARVDGLLGRQMVAGMHTDASQGILGIEFGICCQMVQCNAMQCSNALCAGVGKKLECIFMLVGASIRRAVQWMAMARRVGLCTSAVVGLDLGSRRPCMRGYEPIRRFPRTSCVVGET